MRLRAQEIGQAESTDAHRACHDEVASARRPGNLDPELRREIMGLFDRFNQVGVTVLVASHDLDLIGEFGHALLRLEQGELVGIEGGEA